MRQVHDSLVVVAPTGSCGRRGRLRLHRHRARRRGGRTGPVVVGRGDRLGLPAGRRAGAAVVLLRRCLDHLKLHVLEHVLLDAVHAVEVGVEAVLTSVLLAALRADDVRVLVAEVDVLDVPLKTHLVEILRGEKKGTCSKILCEGIDCGLACSRNLVEKSLYSS